MNLSSKSIACYLIINDTIMAQSMIVAISLNNLSMNIFEIDFRELFQVFIYL